MKVGISVRVDVTKIEKDRIFEGKKGKYLDLTTFVDLDNVDEYGNNGFISQSVSKEERQNGVKTPILGNVKVFYTDTQSGADSTQNVNDSSQGQNSGGGDFDRDIPFAKVDGRFV